MIKLLIILLLGIFYVGFLQPQPAQTTSAPHGVAVKGDADQILADAFERHQNHLQLQGQGKVIKILKDDREGLEHQRFILRLANGRSLLVAHNIDLTPRIENLQVGDTVEFYGEYEWNPQGGVLHWTHRDPHHHHIDGWLKHDGNTYQ